MASFQWCKQITQKQRLSCSQEMWHMVLEHYSEEVNNN